MSNRKTTETSENKMTDTNSHLPFYNASSGAARSTVAVIDALTTRGAFKGEELSTIGQLRDACIQIQAMAESFKSAQAAAE